MYSGNTNIINNKGVTFLKYAPFNNIDFIIHASSTRIGGVSKGELGSMNFGAPLRDSAENIRKNYELFCDAAGIDIRSLVISSQFHNANIKVCAKEDRGAGVLYPLPYSDIDALVTNEAGVTLCVFSADCVPVLFADIENRAIGACHCGWKGTYKELAKLTFLKMKELYGTNEENIRVVIAPGIKKCCYEVSGELYKDFEEKFGRIAKNDALEIRDSRFFLDLPLFNKYILTDLNIPEENIFVSDLCPCCESELLHSHRATAGKRGIMGHFIGIVT